MMNISLKTVEILLERFKIGIMHVHDKFCYQVHVLIISIWEYISF